MAATAAERFSGLCQHFRQQIEDQSDAGASVKFPMGDQPDRDVEACHIRKQINQVWEDVARVAGQNANAEASANHGDDGWSAFNVDAQIILGDGEPERVQIADKVAVPDADKISVHQVRRARSDSRQSRGARRRQNQRPPGQIAARDVR